MRLGFIYFTDKEKSQKGVAAVYGETPFHLNHVGELQTDIYWFTNHPDGIPGGASRHALYFGEKYLRVSVEKILAELCVPKDAPIERQVEILSQVFHNVVSCGRKIFGIEDLPRFEYRKALRDVLRDVDNIPYPDNVNTMITDSTMYYTLCSEKVSRDKCVSFQVPRIKHAQGILNTPLPDGEWKKIPNGKMPQFPEQVKEWIEERQTPYFAKVVFSGFDEKYSSIINFGSVTPDKSKRQWVTGIELTALLGMAEIDIQEAWECEGVFATPRSVEEEILILPEVAELSYSMCLFLDNLWTGLSLKNIPHYLKSKTVQNYNNPCGPFLRAADWKMCFEKAVALKDMGFTVASFGVGKIVVDGTYITDDEIYQAAKVNGLLPPVCNATTPSAQEDKSKFALLQGLYQEGNSKDLVEVDQIFINKYLAM